MAFAAITGGSATGSTTANQSTTPSFTYAESYSAGNLILFFVAVDNNQTTDGDEAAVSSVTDVAGNVFTKAKAFTNGQGTAQTGATVELWYSVLTAPVIGGLTGGPQGTFSNATSRDAAVVGYKGFTIGTATVAIEGTPATLANDGADPGSLNVTTTNIACLRVRCIAAETNSSTALTVTASWTALPSNQTASGGATANIALRGEYRIATGTSFASDPTFTAVDCASVYVAFKEVSGTANTQNLGGGITPAAIATKAVKNNKGGSLTPSAVARKAVSIFKSGGITPSGVSIKLVAKRLGGGLTPSGSVNRILFFLVSIAGSIVPSGVVSKLAAATKSGSLTPAGSAIKAVAVNKTGSLSPSGVLAVTKFFFSNLGGSIIPSATIRDAVSKNLSGTVTPSAQLTKADAKPLGGSIAPLGSLGTTSPTSQALGGSVASAGTIRKDTSVFKVGTLVPASAIAKLASIFKGGSITPAGASSSGRLSTASLSGSLLSSGAITRAVSKSLGGPIAMAGVIAKLVSKFLSGTLTLAGSVVSEILAEVIVGVIRIREFLAALVTTQTGNLIIISDSVGAIVTTSTGSQLRVTQRAGANITTRDFSL